MIKYYKDKKLFFIGGKGYSYIMYVNGYGFLQHLYYGKAIKEQDAEYLIKTYGEKLEPQPDSGDFEMQTCDMPCEYSAFGRGDYHEPGIIIEREDGSVMSRFLYLSHSISAGAPDISDMPHARVADETLSIKLKDSFSDVITMLNYTVSENSAVLVRNAEIKNCGSGTIKLKRAASFVLDLPDSGFDMLRLEGNWASERHPEITPIGHGITKLQSTRGASSHQLNPFMALLRRNCTEEYGECYGAQLVYSGSFTLSSEVSGADALRLQGGINDTHFSWKLSKGETFVTPQAALCYSKEGLGQLSREYSDFLRESIISPEWVFEKRPIVINSWEATYFDFDNEKLFSIIDKAAELGVDTFVLDDGWFGNRNSDKCGLGDWFVNESKLKGGLKAVADRCRQRGLRFGLWFEPEMVSEDSELYRAHPDWAIGKPGQEPCRGRSQLTLDFSRDEIVTYIYEMISRILSENDISYVKWDMNRTMSEYFSSSLSAECQGELMHRYILGVYSLAERLTSAFPQVFFEGCAGGGGRFDAGMLYYFPQIWTSDDTDGLERTKIQWGTSLAYPLSAMSCHVSACPNHQTQRITPFETRGAVASLGATGYELNPGALNNEEREAVKKQIKEYKRIGELILKGDLYRLSNPFKENYFCEMAVSKDKTRAYAVGEQFRATPDNKKRFLRLYGLDPQKTYRIEELQLSASGAVLMNCGIMLPHLHDCESFVWHIGAEA